MILDDLVYVLLRLFFFLMIVGLPLCFIFFYVDRSNTSEELDRSSYFMRAYKDELDRYKLAFWLLMAIVGVVVLGPGDFVERADRLWIWPWRQL